MSTQTVGHPSNNRATAVLPRYRISSGVALLSALISFAIYATLVFLLHPAQNDNFLPERSSFAAAASNVYYEAPLGKVYSGVLARFFETSPSGATLPIEQLLAEAAQNQIMRGPIQANTVDGNGIGYIIVADIGFRLFGPHVASVVGTMLLLMGISAAAFFFRFRDQRTVVVILYFTSLTIMLFTTLVWGVWHIAIPIGGIRYFSLVAILPAFHLMLECAGTRGLSGKINVRHLVPLAMQVVIFLLAILVRNSAAPLIAAVATGCLLYAWRLRRNRVALNRLLTKAGYMVVVGFVFVGVLMMSVSRGYLADGRFTETVWHRIFVSLGLSPTWPFGTLQKIYNCEDRVSSGLINGPDDRNGLCVWLVYARNHNLSTERLPYLTYSRQYDSALREAFFKILWSYPAEVLDTFFHIKPRYILWSVGESLKIDLAPIPRLLIWLLAAALANLFLFGLSPWPVTRSDLHLTIGSATALFAAFSIMPYIAVWAMPHTSADLTFYCLFGLGLAATVAIGKIRAALMPFFSRRFARPLPVHQSPPT
jgi:hypothetical protein